MELFAARCPWYVAGPLIGLCVVGLLWAANLPLGATGAYVGLVDWIRRPRSGPGWRVFFLGSVVLGGFLSALAAGELMASFAFGSFDATFGDSLATKAAVLVGSGTVMGFGARTAGGCTSGHGVCGTSLGSPASFAATATFMGTAIVATHVAAWIGAIP